MRSSATIGGLPERTPLNPQVVGTVARKGYRVEKIIFESQPKHYVTGLLFLPDAKRFPAPYPGVLVPCGHAFEAKGYDAYQSVGALLALNGMVAFVFDPIDQGERGQYMGKDGWPKLWGIDAHTQVGICSIPLGRNTALFEIWDGMRAIDYLQSRPEVDPKRIGCTGNSGGATQTAFLMALDDRIHAAAPSCYLTSTERELKHRGADDAEQQIFNQLIAGPHEADFVMMRAPSPVLMLAATHDFFDIRGAWDSFRYAKRLFTRMDLAERVDMLENDAGHNYDAVQREAAARWMSRWLLRKDRVIVEPKIVLLSEKEYTCTPDGKVMSLPGARSVYDLNEDYENRLLAWIARPSWATYDRKAPLDRGAEGGRHSQVGRPAETPGRDARYDCADGLQDREARDPARRGHRAARHCCSCPKNGTAARCCILTTRGRRPTRAWAARSRNSFSSGTPSWPSIYAATAKPNRPRPDCTAPITRTRKSPTCSAARSSGCGRKTCSFVPEIALERTSSGPDGDVDLVAVGNIGIPALHAAALEPDLFHGVKLRRMLVSWANIVHNRVNRSPIMGSLIHGSLLHYDLPNLEATLGEKLTVEQPVNVMGVPIGDGK